MNMNEEVRYGYTISEKMKKVWSIQLKMAEALMAVCKKYDLKIWAGSGTLIGAVRDQGFIPWDDDMDFGMFREDYDRLVEVADKEFKSPLFFQTAYNENDYSHGHAQLRMDGTTAILPSEICRNYHLGIFIDIFVLDAVPDDIEEYAALKQKATAMKKRLDVFCYKGYGRGILYYIYTRILLSAKGIHSYFQEYNDLFRKFKIAENERVCYMAYRFNERKIFNKHYYDDILYVPFEDILMPVPLGYDSILRAEYGDYTIRKQPTSSHGGYIVLDPDRPYSDYLPELRKQWKRQRWVRALKRIVNIITRKDK